MVNTSKTKKEKKTESTDESQKDVLTLEILQDIVLDGIQNLHDEKKVKARHFEETRQLLNFLFTNSLKLLEICKDKEDEGEKYEMKELQRNALLLGYTHYVCNGDTNPYNWGYLLDIRKKYATFLCKYASYIAWVVTDLNILLKSLKGKKNLTFIIDGFIELKIKTSDAGRNIEGNVCFDNLNSIYSVTPDGYRLTIKKNESILGVFWRSRNNALDHILNFINL